MTNYEWIKKETQPAQQEQASPANTQEAFKLPDPNTPPILYGDDYPGPDEPLYQPQPDEKIWLTDADGHGDIYDNDSIRINYAPGFDKSQITKINAYRNGVIMRFLPDMFDVLTNAQMKTFDGNRLEHSPASSHTDHAIMGYEYEFKILTADHVWIMKKTVKSGFRWRPKKVWMRINGEWAYFIEQSSYGDIVKFFQKIRQDGFTGIELDIPYYLATPYSNQVIENTELNPYITIWKHITPTQEKLEKILEIISTSGLHIHILCMFYIKSSYSPTEYNVWKGTIDPTDPARFFTSYTETLEKTIPILNKYGAELFTILDETDTIYQHYPDLVEKLISDVASKFQGSLGIDISSDLMKEYFTGELDNHSFRQILEKMAFFSWNGTSSGPLNIEYSLRVPPLETQRDQRTSIMDRNFVKFWKPTFDNMSLLYPDNPQSFGEMVTYPADGVGLGFFSYWDIPNKILDKQEAADIWYCYLSGAKTLGIDSINVWTVPFLDSGKEEVLTGFINIGVAYQQSPDYRVITSIIKPEE